MWLLYLLALVLGGGLLLVQLAGGGHHGLDHAFGADHLGGPGHHPAGGPGMLSTRSVTYGLFAFGFVGVALHVLALTGPRGAFAVAASAGIATTLAVGTTLRAVGDPAASGEAALVEARGTKGRVLIPMAPGQPGKVRVQIKGQTVDLVATTDGRVLEAGSEVMVVDVKGDVAEVVAAGEVTKA
jgi:membrane protein implicated in regulation of membrane protease activity